MVRDWMEGSFESLASAVAEWFADLQITSLTGDSCAPPPSLDRLSYHCLSLRSQKAKDQKHTDDERRRFSQQLLHAALTGARLSDVLPLRILSCLRPELSSADSGQEDAPLQPDRFAVLRAYLVRFFRERGDLSMCNAITPALNPDLPCAALYASPLVSTLGFFTASVLAASHSPRAPTHVRIGVPKGRRRSKLRFHRMTVQVARRRTAGPCRTVSTLFRASFRMDLLLAGTGVTRRLSPHIGLQGARQ
jgi:hypothetical protein